MGKKLFVSLFKVVRHVTFVIGAPECGDVWNGIL